MASERYVATALLLFAAGCSRGGSGLRFSPAATLTTPTSVGTAPMLAVSSTGSMASAWVSAPGGGIDGRMYVDVGSGEPAEVQDSLGPIEGKGESPPKLAFGADGSLNAIYVVDRDDSAYKAPLEALRFVRSINGGKSWTRPVTVSNDAEFGAHNFHALHVAHDGTLYVSWLGGEIGKATPWISHSSDGGATWTPQVQVDSGETCDCCRTTLASTTDGTLYMAWRHVYEGNMRDVVVAKSTDHGDHWSLPVRVHADGWSFNGCPRAGPSLQVDSSGAVHVAWWTGKAGAAGVWYARSNDDAGTFSAPIPIGVAAASRPAHVQLAIGAGGVVAAIWDDGTRATPRILFRLSRDGGRTFASPEELSAPDRAVGFPVLAFNGPAITAAWTESGTAAPAPVEMPAPMPNHDPNAHRGIKPIGAGKVIVRRATLDR